MFVTYLFISSLSRSLSAISYYKFIIYNYFDLCTLLRSRNLASVSSHDFQTLALACFSIGLQARRDMQSRLAWYAIQTPTYQLTFTSSQIPVAVTPVTHVAYTSCGLSLRHASGHKCERMHVKG